MKRLLGPKGLDHEAFRWGTKIEKQASVQALVKCVAPEGWSDEHKRQFQDTMPKVWQYLETKLEVQPLVLHVYDWIKTLLDHAHEFPLIAGKIRIAGPRFKQAAHQYVTERFKGGDKEPIMQQFYRDVIKVLTVMEVIRVLDFTPFFLIMRGVPESAWVKAMVMMMYGKDSETALSHKKMKLLQELPDMLRNWALSNMVLMMQDNVFKYMDEWELGTSIPSEVTISINRIRFDNVLKDALDTSTEAEARPTGNPQEGNGGGASAVVPDTEKKHKDKDSDDDDGSKSRADDDDEGEDEDEEPKSAPAPAGGDAGEKPDPAPAPVGGVDGPGQEGASSGLFFTPQEIETYKLRKPTQGELKVYFNEILMKFKATPLEQTYVLESDGRLNMNKMALQGLRPDCFPNYKRVRFIALKVLELKDEYFLPDNRNSLDKFCWSGAGIKGLKGVLWRNEFKTYLQTKRSANRIEGKSLALFSQIATEADALVRADPRLQLLDNTTPEWNLICDEEVIEITNKFT